MTSGSKLASHLKVTWPATALDATSRRRQAAQKRKLRDNEEGIHLQVANDVPRCTREFDADFAKDSGVAREVLVNGRVRVRLQNRQRIVKM